jgi:hypothetical protein
MIVAVSAMLPALAFAETSASNSTNIIRHETQDGFHDSDVSETQIRHTQVGTQQPSVAAPQQPGQVAPATTAPPATQNNFEQTVVTEKHAPEGGLRNEAVGINPQFGILSLGDVNDDSQARGVAGLIIDVNGLRRVDDSEGRPFFGPSLGVLYSHLGTATSDFFGVNSSDGRNNGTHLLMFPFNLKAGYTFKDIFRPSVHAGGTLIYNNTTANVTGIEVSNSSTTVRANVGMDFEFGIGKSVALMLRPDWIFASNTTIFVGTIGLVFPLS